MRLISLNLACKIAKFSYFLYCCDNYDNCCDNHCLQNSIIFTTMSRQAQVYLWHLIKEFADFETDPVHGWVVTCIGEKNWTQPSAEDVLIWPWHYFKQKGSLTSETLGFVSSIVQDVLECFLSHPLLLSRARNLAYLLTAGQKI